MSKLGSLFKWKKEISIIDNSGVTKDKVYIRIVGDIDYQEAQTIGLLASRSLRKNLRNENSLDFKSNFTDLNDRTKEEFIIGIVMSEINDYRDLAITKFPVKDLPELPDEPTLEQREEYEEQLEKIRTDRTNDVKKFMEDKTEQRKKELEEKNIDELKDSFTTATINMRCLEEFNKEFKSYCVYKGTFTDNKLKKLAFDSFDEFKDSSPYMKVQLINAYTDLELSGEDLKN